MSFKYKNHILPVFFVYRAHLLSHPQLKVATLQLFVDNTINIIIFSDLIKLYQHIGFVNANRPRPNISMPFCFKDILE